MHSHDDKYPSRPGFEPGTPRLQASVDTNEPSELAVDPNKNAGETSSLGCKTSIRIGLKRLTRRVEM